jgi:hypothetical protein
MLAGFAGILLNPENSSQWMALLLGSMIGLVVLAPLAVFLRPSNEDDKADVAPDEGAAPEVHDEEAQRPADFIPETTLSAVHHALREREASAHTTRSLWTIPRETSADSSQADAPASAAPASAAPSRRPDAANNAPLSPLVWPPDNASPSLSAAPPPAQDAPQESAEAESSAWEVLDRLSDDLQDARLNDPSLSASEAGADAPATEPGSSDTPEAFSSGEIWAAPDDESPDDASPRPFWDFADETDAHETDAHETDAHETDADAPETAGAPPDGVEDNPWRSGNLEALRSPAEEEDAEEKPDGWRPGNWPDLNYDV